VLNYFFDVILNDVLSLSQYLFQDQLLLIDRKTEGSVSPILFKVEINNYFTLPLASLNK